VQRSSTDTKRFVAQVSDQRAFAWVGQSVWHHQEDGTSTHLTFTTRADLARPDPQAPWQITQVVRQPHSSLRHVRTSKDGQTYAVLGNEQGQWLVRLDTQTGEWIDQRAMPTLLPGWLVDQRMSVRYFWSNGPYQVISLWGDIEVPRLLFPFGEEPASITTDAHFYTDNGGTSWHQLAIPDYLGVMGLAEKGPDLFWTKGNWFENDEPYVWRYDLAQ